LTIEKGSKILKDGYRRYVVAKTVKNGSSSCCL
jgi:hypothetical protein